MKSRKFYLFSVAVLLPGCFFIAQSFSAAQTSATPEETPTELSLIHRGDLIDVDVVGSTEYDWRGTLNPEGFLDGIENIENPIFGLCRSEESVAAEVAKAYGKNLRDPQVVVKILDRSNRPQSVIYGAIKTPQRFQIKRPIYLNELLVVAGGLTERASGQVQIYRPKSLNCQPPSSSSSDKAIAVDGERREKFVAASQADSSSIYLNIRISDLLVGKKEANPQILSGDIVTVLEADSIYVIGGVASPNRVSARSQMTLSRAIAMVGGITKNGDARDITIYRREAGETKIIFADLEKIKAGKEEDLILQAFDIVEVAQTGREKTKFPPILKNDYVSEKKTANLPLRIID